MSYASQGEENEEEQEPQDKSDDLELNQEQDRMTIYNYLHQTEAPKAIEQMQNGEHESELEEDIKSSVSDQLDSGEAHIRHELHDPLSRYQSIEAELKTRQEQYQSSNSKLEKESTQRKIGILQ